MPLFFVEHLFAEIQRNITMVAYVKNNERGNSQSSSANCSHKCLIRRAALRITAEKLVSLIQLSLGFENPPRREFSSRGVVLLLSTVTTPFCVGVPAPAANQSHCRNDTLKTDLTFQSESCVSVIKVYSYFELHRIN